MAASENHFALELNEKEVIELLKNTRPGSLKKATKYLIKQFVLGYEMIIANSALSALFAIYHLICNAHIWNT